MWNSHAGSPSSGEPLQKKPRLTDDLNERLGQAVGRSFDPVVGAAVRRLSADDAESQRVYDSLRTYLMGKVATTPGLVAQVRAHEGRLLAPVVADLTNRAAEHLQTLREPRGQKPAASLSPLASQTQPQPQAHPQQPQQKTNGSSPFLPPRVETPVPVPRPPPFLPRKSPTPTNTQLPQPLPPSNKPSQSPIPLPSYGNPSLAAPPPISRTESHIPVPAFPPLDNNVLRERHPPPAVTAEERKFSNSPIPLPVIPQHSSALARIPQPQLSQPVTLATSNPYPDAPRQNTPKRANQARAVDNITHPIPITLLRKKSQLTATSPENFRTRAHALALRKVGDSKAPREERPSWASLASLASRPYKSASCRQEIVSGTRQFVRLQPNDLPGPEVIHVDFTSAEVQQLLSHVKIRLGRQTTASKNARKELLDLLRDHNAEVFKAVSLGNAVRYRTVDDLKSYLYDLTKDLASKKRTKARDPVIISLERDDYDRQGALTRSGRVNSLLLAREVGGQRGYGSMRRLENFTNEFRRCREDDLELRAEWTNCAGDIATITWLSDDSFICGTTEHSDAHNQQYNKEGNLVLGSCSRGTLRAFSDHRIVRPIIEKGENSTDAMVRSQSPWLYTSVVSSDYDERHDRAYTCGFDRTVKVWKADKFGASMSTMGTWHHEGNVNFVVASKHESGMVATAADVATEAVRVYHVDNNDISGSPFRAYSCSRVVDLEGNAVSTDKWAYFPATIQWGRCEGAQHLVAVGYSPRSRTQDDNDIPEDRRGTGEICVWDGLTGERWNIVSGSKLNVFEIVWHPTQPCFIAATSPQGLQGVELDARIRTQIRVFIMPDHPEYGGKTFTVCQTLDCTAVDINELAIMPNSAAFSYVTAGCTDGKTYVWDTSQGDKPVHVLKHGTPIEEFHGDRESEDTGVKFCAWGTTPDRFYTGSSDGVVKVWNVRTKGKPRYRDLLEVPGPVSFGKFSPDMSKLIIGDATGRVFFLSVDEEEQKPAQIINLAPLDVALPNGKRKTRRPQAIILHPEPDAPTANGEVVTARAGNVGEAATCARLYLQRQHLVIAGNPVVGAVQGPRYAETGLFCRELHADDDPAKPLLAAYDILQQDSRIAIGQLDPFGLPKFERRAQQQRPLRPNPRVAELHTRNLGKNLDLSQLSEETKAELRAVGACVEVEFDFEYEDTESESESELEDELDRDDALVQEKPQAVELRKQVEDHDMDGDEDDYHEIMESSEQEWRSSQYRRLSVLNGA